MESSRGNVFSGAFLIAGTTIGGGMLALPVLTSQAGFFPSLAIYLLCWLFMVGTGLLFWETSTWIKPLIAPLTSFGQAYTCQLNVKHLGQLMQ